MHVNIRVSTSLKKIQDYCFRMFKISSAPLFNHPAASCDSQGVVVSISFFVLSFYESISNYTQR